MQTVIAEKAQLGLRADLVDGVARVTFDAPGSKVNTLRRALVVELDSLLDALAANAEVRAVVLASGKPDCFVAGADIDEIEALATAEAAQAAAEFGQRVFAKIESFPKPVVAAVKGVCLGGGCEMVLACHWRVLADDPATRIGLPEVTLGILPGFGGTQRLPRVVGLQAALDLILAGRKLDARRALRAGLADEICPPALLAETAAGAALRLAAAGRFRADRPRRRPLWTLPGFLDGTPVGHAVVLRAAGKRVRRETRGNYPAPLAALEAVRAGLRSEGCAYPEEARLLGRLAMSDVSRNLVGIYRLTEANKKLGSDLPRPAGKARQIGVVGAGVMGGGIAYLAASNDVRVRMKDLGPEPLLAAFRTARDLFQDQVRRGRLDGRGLENKMAHITAAMDTTGFSLSDVVVEAVVENLDVKRQVLRELEKSVRDDCVLASNTSSLSIGALAEALHRPERCIGMHFFNPVHRMPLVEVVRGPRTDPAVVARTIALARQLGKTPVLVNDGPGFLVNRILAPYMNECAWAFQEGHDVEALDRLMKRFGMPMGPFELLDEVGTDVADKVGHVLHQGLGDRARPAPLAGQLHAAGRLGRKSGAGVYLYGGKGGRERRPDPATWSTLRPAGAGAGTKMDDAALLDRVFGLMINEAARCLDEGIVAGPGDLDLALVFGIGFPPFRGGLLKYADGRGLQALADRLREFEARLGSRFAPAERLTRMATSGERFFPLSRDAARG
jgi:3-hydroxyacyl-CoA dehydrogenase/enoyl-CoA hydratase/3-hydroxybutyryl-CoA epimerase